MEITMLDVRKKIVVEGDHPLDRELTVVGRLETGTIVGHVQVGSTTERRFVLVSPNSGRVLSQWNVDWGHALRFINKPVIEVYYQALDNEHNIKITKVEGKITEVELANG